MDRDFAGRVVLVTGGGRGVGRAITRVFAARGAYVIVNCFHSEAEARDTVEGVASQTLSGYEDNYAGERAPRWAGDLGWPL